MAAHSSILAWRVPWTEEPGGPQSMGSHRVDMTERLSMHTCIRKHFLTELPSEGGLSLALNALPQS